MKRCCWEAGRKQSSQQQRSSPAPAHLKHNPHHCPELQQQPPTAAGPSVQRVPKTAIAGDAHEVVPSKAACVRGLRWDMGLERSAASTRQFKCNFRTKSCPNCSWSSFQTDPRKGTRAGHGPGCHPAWYLGLCFPSSH